MLDKNMDKFEMHLDEMILKVQKCQEDTFGALGHKINGKALKSCSGCELYFTCSLRIDYVKSVYNSMSKGETGGFEF